MSILRIYEKLWIIAAVTAFGLAGYKAYELQVFSSSIYFPIIVGILCLIVFFSKRQHRKFIERHKAEAKQSETSE